MLNEIFIEDVTSKVTFFYPCSGMDIKAITDLLEYKDDYLCIENFVMADLNISEDNYPEMPGYCKRMHYFDNKLGLNKIEIIEKEVYGVNEIEFMIKDQLVDYPLAERFNYLVQYTVDPKAIRYELRYKSKDFVLYLFHYDALIIMKKIKNLNLLNSLNLSGLILKGHVYGSIGKDLFADKIIEFDSQVLILNDKSDNYPNYDYELDRINEDDQSVQFAYLQNENLKKLIKLKSIMWQL
ncbi:MAG: hypothetical protein ACOYLP_04230 [Flavobacterium sp.]|uniref:hypothetical protein n=1 Tax=Flavobacterium sp. TaxID=239 RepID=UPI003BDD4B66